MSDESERLRDLALADPANDAILEGLRRLGLSDAWLAAGCLYQAVWNARDGRPPGWGIKDYDVFYWDDDLSWEAEDAVIRRAEALLAPLGVILEIRNQARVPLWFEARFGVPYPPVARARDGIDRFLVAGTCVGLSTAGEVYAPFGLRDLFDGVLRLNPRTPNPALFREKAESYRARWPWLTVVEPAGDGLD